MRKIIKSFELIFKECFLFFVFQFIFFILLYLFFIIIWPKEFYSVAHKTLFYSSSIISLLGVLSMLLVDEPTRKAVVSTIRIRGGIIFIRPILYGFFISLCFVFSIISLLAFLKVSTIKFSLFSFDFIPCTIILLIAAFVEEILFRGIVLNKLRSVPSATHANILFCTSIVFALMHIFNPYLNFLAFINLCLFSAIITELMFLYNNFYFVWSLHFSWNFFLGLVFGNPVSGFRLNSMFSQNISTDYYILSGGNFGIEGSVITSGLLFFCLIVLAKKANQQNITITK